MIILFTKNNLASANIAKKLIEGHGFEKSKANAPGDEAGSPAETTLGQAAMEVWEREGVMLIDTNAPTVLDVPTDFDTDCLIILSTHKSKTPGQMLTAHVPGNWDKAEMGGEPKTLNIAHGLMLKRLIRALDTENRKQKLDWPVCLEADHHGPTCEVPILFVEIGNNEEQWADELAAQVVADAVAVQSSSERQKARNPKPYSPWAGAITSAHSRNCSSKRISPSGTWPRNTRLIPWTRGCSPRRS